MTTPRAVALAAALGAALVLPGTALGTTITVTTTGDSTNGDGLCSLREAVIRANTDVSIDGECNPGPKGADVIALGPGTFRLTSAGRGEDVAQTGDLDLIGPVSITGAGVALTTIDARGIDRVFDARPGAVVTITGVTITGGVADPGTTLPSSTSASIGTFGGNGTAGACGGGIRATSATLTLSASTVAGNAAGAGGAGAPATGANGRIGAGVGGPGVAAAGGVGPGQNGGSGFGGEGGAGGSGGAITGLGTAVLSVDASAVTGNLTGSGGRGAEGTGAGGGAGGTPGTDGVGIGGPGGPGGRGAGVRADGALTLTRDLLSGNQTGTGGHGGRAFASPVIGLGASADGGDGGPGGDGGAVSGAGAITLVNVTVAGNVTGGGGGAGGHGVAVPSSSGDGGTGGAGGGLASTGDLRADHITLAGNGAGSVGTSAFEGGVDGVPGTPGSGGSAGVSSVGSISITASILSGNACDSTSIPIVDNTGNVAFQASGCTGAGLDPRLGPLADNGGPTATMKPGPGSPALDRLPAGPGCPATDQRGALRPGGAGCDVGALELSPPAVTTGAASALTGASARVAGTLDTRGLDTTYRVEFGATTTYGRQVAAATAPGAATPTVLGVPLTGLAPLTTYHYRLVAIGPDGSATGADRSFTTTAATVAGGPGAPRVSRLRIAPTVFAVVPKGGVLRPGTRGRVALGARISFVLSEAATVRLVVQRTVAGNRVRRKGRLRCVAAPPGRRIARAARCTLHPPKGTLRSVRTAGAARVVLTGRFGRRTLAPGSYRIVVSAVDATGARSRPVRALFRVVRPAG